MKQEPEKLVEQMKSWGIDFDLEFDVKNLTLLDELNRTPFPTMKIYPKEKSERPNLPRVEGTLSILNGWDVSDLPPEKKALALAGIVECLARISLEPTKATVRDDAVTVEFVLVEGYPHR